MTFRYAGVAWDGQHFVVAPALRTFGDQILAIRPGAYPADGTVASQAHDRANPTSDHTVWPVDAPAGIVYAIDFAEEGGLSVDAVLEAVRLSKDERLKYAIHDRRMFSSYPVTGYPPFTWRPYRGSNPHAGHGHLSVQHNASAGETHPWHIGDDDMPDTELTKQLQESMKRAGITGKDDKPIVVDGKLGANTRHGLNVWARRAMREPFARRWVRKLRKLFGGKAA